MGNHSSRAVGEARRRFEAGAGIEFGGGIQSTPKYRIRQLQYVAFAEAILHRDRERVSSVA
jgi:hypothetical protein